MRRDWLFVAVVVAAAVVESIVREPLVWRIVSLVVAVGIAGLLPWRRVHPLVAVVVAFATVSAVEAVSILRDVQWEGLNSAFFMVVFPYALTRWASARGIGIGYLVMSVPVVLSGVAGAPADQTLGDTLGGAAVLLLAGAIGVAVRYASELRAQELAGLQSREREALARELHDTVAHHVSAIAVRAQAGRVVAAARPEAAVDALSVIEEEASRALEEMRAIVGTLRRDERADRRPQQGVRDLPRLEQRSGGPGPRVVVNVIGDLDDLGGSVDAACFRLVQEAVTNALRHARQATEVQVQVEGADDVVRVRVVDDGRDAGATGASTSGYGLVGMAERTKLLGGTFAAGPCPDGGWAVEASFPRRASTS